MHLLLSNDDGIDSPGLRSLADALEGLGTLTVVAPLREQSASSHALTMHDPLRLITRRDHWFAVTGTPADCVYMGVHHVLRERPALVVSGINRGTNIGDDIHYSGTVAAAMEAALIGIPSIAVSLESSPDGGPSFWDTAAHLARRVAEALLADPLTPHSFLNLNVPNRLPHDVLGLKVTSMGRRVYHPLVSEHKDPRGRPYYWIGGEHHKYDTDAQTDGYWFERGYATLTPLRPNLTDAAALGQIQRWTIANSG
jgi:5'-nucleotidase